MVKEAALITAVGSASMPPASHFVLNFSTRCVLLLCHCRFIYLLPETILELKSVLLDCLFQETMSPS